MVMDRSKQLALERLRRDQARLAADLAHAENEQLLLKQADRTYWELQLIAQEEDGDELRERLMACLAQIDRLEAELAEHEKVLAERQYFYGRELTELSEEIRTLKRRHKA